MPRHNLGHARASFPMSKNPSNLRFSTHLCGGLLSALALLPQAIQADPAWKEVYNPFTVRSLHLQVDPTDWNRVINDQPEEGQTASQERAEAWFNGEGETPILVEIRRKGATDPVLTSGGLTKASLKIDINALVPGQRWNGLRKLSLEIGGTDGPLHEGFGWQVHRRAAEAGYYGYDAANAAWVKLYVNGNFHGVFSSTEQRDEQLLRNRDLYSPNNTWLYKVDGSHTLEEGIGDSPTFQHLNFAPFQGNGAGAAPDLDIDLPQWIDMESMLTLGACNAYLENSDGLFKRNGKNSFAADFQPPNQRLRIYLPWDLDTVIKQGTEDIYGSFYRNEIIDDPWFQRVYEHTLRELIDGPLSEAALHAFLNDLEAVLAPELAADPFISAGAGSFASLRNWVTDRNANVLSQLLLPYVSRPLFNQDGGEVVSGFELTMATPGGQIYYTLDGTDPRAPGGGVGASAQLYSSPVIVDRTTKVTARTLDASNWSALATDATFNIAAYATAMRVTEIMYHPAADDPLDAVDEDAYEFLELHNSGPTPLELGGFFFGGITFTFPASTSISPGAYVVLVRDSASFAARYPGVSYDGIYLGKLSNSGEKIRLKNAEGTTVISIDYDDDPPWVLSPDGLGYSLVNVNLSGDPDDAMNWRASRDVHGSPGATDPLVSYALTPVLNEVIANTAPPFEDAIEIHNTGSGPADLSGWFLSDEARDPNGDLTPALLKKFKLPSGSSIPGGGHAAFYENAFNHLNALVPFSLSPFGGRAYLSSADSAGNLTGHIIALDFPATDPNTAYGRIGTSVGVQNARLATPTFGVSTPTDLTDFRSGGGAPNSPPLVGPVVLSEIMYNPLESGSEFVELYNLSGSVVEISGWDIDGIGGFAFPPGTFLPAGGFVLLVDTAKITPSAFRSAYSVPASVDIFGTLFDLGNAGESLRLEKPNPIALQPDIRLERVRYNDKSPWPTEADGAGPSLERFAFGGYGNEPLNWRSAAIGGSPGTAGSFSSGIAITKESTWDYKATASTLGTAWQTVDYNATSWHDAVGASGYGESFLNTILPFGPNPLDRFNTTYFRKQFVINDAPATITSLDLSLLYDDGIVVYLNGKEVARRSLPGGTIAYETLATDREAIAYETVDLLPFKNCLIQGTNILAVEVHQSGPTSADLVWDAELLYATATSGNDDDGDGMYNDWENANGLDPNDPTDAPLDNDGDRRSNLDEFVAGTDPQDPSSSFQIALVERLPSGSVRILWESKIGKSYRISYSPDLINWFGYGSAGDLTATTTTSEFIDPSGNLPNRRFYRIGVSP